MLLLTAVSVLLIPALARIAPLVEPRSQEHVIPGKYIVVLKDPSGQEVGGLSRHEHDSWLVNMLAGDTQDGSAVEHSFNLNGIAGYTGKFSEKILESIRARHEVEYVEPDQVVYALDSQLDTNSLFRRKLYSKELKKKESGIYGKFLDTGAIWEGLLDELKDLLPDEKSELLEVQEGAPWGLSRVCHAKMPSGLNEYTYPKSAGEGVNVYIVDTGINIAHEDFEGRAKWGATIPMFDEDIDGNGHGTHCAGTIGGKTYGIAKKANLIAVKVLRTNGFGTNSDVIKGIEWVIKAHKKGTGKQSVANMSLGGGRSLTLEKVVNKAVESGVHFAVAAGNDNEDACNYSPAAAEGPITVGASTNQDTMAFFSNHGSCVDIFAPGLDIKSTWIGGKDAVNTISGTSMASPHVAGVLALHLSQKKYKPDELKKLLKEQATKGALTGLPESSENLLLSIEPLLKEL